MSSSQPTISDDESHCLTLRISNSYVQGIDNLIKKDVFGSRSQYVRSLIRSDLRQRGLLETADQLEFRIRYEHLLFRYLKENSSLTSVQIREELANYDDNVSGLLNLLYDFTGYEEDDLLIPTTSTIQKYESDGLLRKENRVWDFDRPLKTLMTAMNRSHALQNLKSALDLPQFSSDTVKSFIETSFRIIQHFMNIVNLGIDVSDSFLCKCDISLDEFNSGDQAGSKLDDFFQTFTFFSHNLEELDIVKNALSRSYQTALKEDDN